MNSEYAEKWLNKLKDYWIKKNIESAVSLFTKTTFYQETPFMKPYTTVGLSNISDKPTIFNWKVLQKCRFLLMIIL